MERAAPTLLRDDGNMPNMEMIQIKKIMGNTLSLCNVFLSTDNLDQIESIRELLLLIDLSM